MAIDYAEIDAKVEAWTREFIRIYRPLGFLKQGHGLSDDELVKMFLEYDEELFETFDSVETVLDDCDDYESIFTMDELESLPKTHQGLDMRMLAIFDPDRVWWRYKACDFDGDVTDYVMALKSWAEISRGAYKPHHIRETAVDGNKVVLEFSLGNEHYQIHGEYKEIDYGYGDEKIEKFPDPKILGQINPLIHYQGMRFFSLECFNKEKNGAVEYVPFNATEYVVVLTESELKQLERARGWSFKA